jgi:hypothetical protein
MCELKTITSIMIEDEVHDEKNGQNFGDICVES